METLLVAQHRNQYYNRSKNQATARFGSFGSPPSGDLRGLNCRGFQSDLGILPSPLKACTTPRGAFSPSPAPQSLSSSPNSLSDDSKHMKRAKRSSSIPINFTSPSNDKRTTRSRSITIPINFTSPSDDSKPMRREMRSSSIPIPINIKANSNKEGRYLFDEFSYSELWAGPSYSNSPPPSSVPIPKFSLQTMRTVSLDLPSATSRTDLLPIFKSAPASPTRELDHSEENLICGADSATEYLRRVLHLDLTD